MPMVAAVALPIVANANAVLEFATYLHTAYQWLRGLGKPPEGAIERRDLQSLSNILTPTAKDESSATQICPVVNGHVHGNLIVNINHLDANAAQNVATRKMAELREPVRTVYEKVVLYWYQARNDVSSGVGDKAVVESISPRPVKTLFMDQGVKATVLFAEANLFKKLYIADLAVELVDARPVLYKITAIHDSYDRDS